MAEQPLVSIIVPVYNVEKYLVECLESLRCQTYRNLEIICVNDGSQDRSQLLLDMFAELDSRIVVIKQENRGVSAARNTGIEASHGDIVMFVDSDDALESIACKTVVETFGRNDPTDVVVFGASLIGNSWEEDPWIYENTNVRDIIYNEFSLDALFSEHAEPFVWHNAFSREFIKKNNLRFDEEIGLGEDKIFLFSAFPRTKRTVFISDQIYRYRVSRAGSLMDLASKNTTKNSRANSTAQNNKNIEIGKGNAARILRHTDIVDRICECWTESGDMDKYAPELFKWTLDFMGYDTLSLNPYGQQDVCEKMNNLWKKWFSSDVIKQANLSKGYMQRYKWMSGTYSLDERAEICKKNDKNARTIEIEKLGKTEIIKRAIKAPLRKIYHGFKHVFPTPANSNSAYLGYIYNKMNKMAEEGGNSSVQTLLLILEIKAQSEKENRLE